LNAAALAMRPFTVVRSRFNWAIVSDQVVAAESFGAAAGGCVVSDQAAAIGVSAVPTPVTDQGSDLFYWYDQHFGRFLVLSAIGFVETGADNMRDIDSKAMRKVNEDEDLIITFETFSFVSSAQITFGGRFLVKLH